MSLIKVDNEKCIKCGLCIKECPEHLLRFTENGPREIYPERCIACGHCVAICPKEAIDNQLSPLSQQKNLKDYQKLSPGEAETFLRSRRSVRTYQDKAVPREKLIDLVNIAHYAPSGHNLQSISYVIVDEKDMINEAVRMVIEEFEKAKGSPEFTQPYREEGIDTILRGAAAIILAVSDKSFQRGRENSILGLEYLELYAPALGLGTCWAGMFERVAMKENSPCNYLFQIPENKRITGTVMVGYPKYTYSRAVDRNPLEYRFVHE